MCLQHRNGLSLVLSVSAWVFCREMPTVVGWCSGHPMGFASAGVATASCEEFSRELGTTRFQLPCPAVSMTTTLVWA
jgi:hypothetical protein